MQFPCVLSVNPDMHLMQTAEIIFAAEQLDGNFEQVPFAFTKYPFLQV